MKNVMKENVESENEKKLWKDVKNKKSNSWKCEKNDFFKKIVKRKERKSLKSLKKNGLWLLIFVEMKCSLV